MQVIKKIMNFVTPYWGHDRNETITIIAVSLFLAILLKGMTSSSAFYSEHSKVDVLSGSQPVLIQQAK